MMSSDQLEYRENEFKLKELISFFVIAFSWTWVLNSFFISGLMEFPAGVGTPSMDLYNSGLIIAIILVMPFGPTFGAFLVTWRYEGRDGIRDLWSRFWSKRISIVWLFIIFLFFPLCFLYIRFSALFLFSIEQPDFLLQNEPLIFIPPLLASILHGGLSEEFGWRGYALPRLQSRFNATTSSIILGIIEGLWHLPLAFTPGYVGWIGRAIIVFFVFWIPVGVFRTWIFNNTKGSVLAAVLFHAIGNTVSIIVPINVMQLIPNGMGYLYLTLAYVPIALVIVIVFGYQYLVRFPGELSQTPQNTHMYLKTVFSFLRRRRTKPHIYKEN